MNFSFRIISTDGSAKLGKLATPRGVIDTPAFVPVGTQATVKSLTPADLKSLGSRIVLANTYHLYLQPGADTVAKLGGLHQMMGWDGPLMTDSGGFQVFSLGWALEHDVGKLVSLFARLPAPDAAGYGGQADDSREEVALRNKEYGVRSRQGKALVKRQKLCIIDDEKATFLSHLDGSLHVWTPEKSIQVQKKLGADLIFALDECTSPLHDKEYTEISMRRSHAWEERSLDKFRKLNRDIKRHPERGAERRVEGSSEAIEIGPMAIGPRFLDFVPTRGRDFAPNDEKTVQAMYGIIQGGPYQDLRIESAKFIAGRDFFGTAVGGALVNKSKMLQILDWVMPLLPPDRPNHLLGIGTIDDILNSVEKGIDTFDCAHPTRIARRGDLLILPQDGGNLKNRWVLNITAKDFAADPSPVSRICQCELCRDGYSRGYLRHLFWAKELLAFRLATIHNLSVMNRLMAEIRQGISDKKLREVKARWLGKES